MKLIIAGSRDINLGGIGELYEIIRGMDLRGVRTPTEVVSGHSGNVDMLGEAWAKNQGTPVKLFPADWNKHGKSAGPLRNRQMAEYGDALVAVWDGTSKGTKNMIDEMTKLGKPVHVHLKEKNLL